MTARIPIVRRRTCNGASLLIRMDDNHLGWRWRFGSRRILHDLTIAGPPVRPIAATNQNAGLREGMPTIHAQGVGMPCEQIRDDPQRSSDGTRSSDGLAPRHG